MDNSKKQQTIASIADNLGESDDGVVFGDEVKEIPEHDSSEPTGPVLSNDGGAVDVSGADDSQISGGTIVTDKKQSRKSVFGVLKNAVGEWTEDKTDTVKNLEVFQKPETPKVVPGTQRRDVIQKAVQGVQQVTQDDHKVVLERIKTFQQDAERVTGKPFVIKAKAKEAEATWTHIVGESSDTSPTSRSITSPSLVHREQMTTAGVAPQVDEHVEASLDDYTKKDEVNIVRENIVVQKGNQNTVPETTVRTELPEQKEQAPVPSTIPTPPKLKVPKIKEKPETAPVKKPEVPKKPEVAQEAPSTIHEINKPSLFSVKRALIFGLVIIFIGGIAAGGLYIFNNRSSFNFDFAFNQDTPVAEPIGFFETDEQISIPLEETRLALLTKTESSIQASSATITEVRFVTTLEEVGVTPVSTQEFFAVLEPRAPSAFIRSLNNEMMIGGIRSDTTDPFIVLKSSAFDIVFAGMIEWEPFMSADLSPLFGEPVARSFDQDARTIDGTLALHFVDTNIDDHHVRVLYDEAGTERIIYSFIERDTILITTTREAFRQLLDHF